MIPRGMEIQRCSRPRAAGAKALVVGASLFALTGASRVVQAAGIDTCLGAYERSQELRQDGKFGASREQLVVCVEPTCPGLVRKDCSQWLGELDAAMPTVIVNARDGEGKDLSGVRVRIDGTVLMEKLDGKAHSVDPGIHLIRYELEGYEATEETLVIQEGEKNRVLWAKLNPPIIVGGVSAGSGGSSNASKIAGVALLGAGAIGLAGFAYFGLSGVQDRDKLAQSCAPHCADADVSAARRKIVAADVSLGVGLAALVGGAWLVLKSPSSSAGMQVGAGPVAGGGVTTFRFIF